MSLWTQGQFESFVQYEKKTAYKIAFNILFYAGLRQGELLALTPDDILDDSSLRINKNYAVVDGNEYFLTPKPKRESGM